MLCIMYGLCVCIVCMVVLCIGITMLVKWVVIACM